MKSFFSFGLEESDFIFLKKILKKTFPDGQFFPFYQIDEGIKFAEKVPPDIIFLTNNSSLTNIHINYSTLKNNRQTKQVPVLVIKDKNFDRPVLESLLEEGVDGFLSKPIDYFECITLVKTLLKKNLGVEWNIDKKALELLHESEEKYRTVFENTGSATCIIEKDGTISLANSRFAELAGYSLNQILNKKKWMEFVVKEDLERMTEQHILRREECKKALNEYEFRFLDANKKVKNIHLFIDVIPRTEKSVASLLDVTESRKTEDKLRESERQLKKAQQIGNIGSWVIDLDSRKVFISGEAQKILIV